MRRYIEIENSRGSVRFGQSKPYLLSLVEGAGNVMTQVSTSFGVGQHGSSFHNARYDIRTIFLKVGIKGKDKADTDNLFRDMMSKLTIQEESKIIFKNYDEIYSIKGSIVNVEETERVSRLKQFIIQIDCYNPFWSTLNDIVEELAIWEPMLEFPLNIDINNKIMFGRRNKNLVKNIVNKGDIATGMTIEFSCSGDVVNPSIKNIYTREEMKFEEGTKFVKGDVIRITSHFANLRIDLFRNNDKLNILHLLESDTFLTLNVGDNVFQYEAVEGLDNLDVNIYHKPQYSGISGV